MYGLKILLKLQYSFYSYMYRANNLHEICINSFTRLNSSSYFQELEKKEYQTTPGCFIGHLHWRKNIQIISNGCHSYDLDIY